MTVSAFLLHALACHRLAQLVTRDRAGGRLFRWRLMRWSYRRHAAGYDVDEWDDLAANPSGWDGLTDADADDSPDLAYLLRCWWCAGLYVCLGMTALFWLAEPVWRFSATALAANTLVVVVANVVALTARS